MRRSILLCVANLAVLALLGCGATDAQSLAGANAGAGDDAGGAKPAPSRQTPSERDDDAGEPADATAADATAADASPRGDAGPHDASMHPEAGGDANLSCTGTSGTFHEQTIESDGESRAYFLYVPSTYACGRPAPLLVDFHGTCGDKPEECYELDAAVALAEHEGVILVRPRSRSLEEGGSSIYRWDENDGDVAKNVTFTETLVASIAARYTIDPTRRYAMGFSSGTNMASQFLDANRTLFQGIGIVCGGVWDRPHYPAAFGANAPRVYVVDGYRDYFYDMAQNLFDDLTRHSYPAWRLFYRQSNAGHNLYPWHYDELWNWLDKGQRASAGALASGWTRDTTFPTQDTLLKMVRSTAGDLVATSASGTFFRRAADTGAWSVATTGSTFASHFVGMCLFPSGRGVAVGYQGTVAQTDDGGRSWSLAPQVPDYSGYFSFSYLMTVACVGESTVLGGGDWAGAKSIDGGKTWTSNAMPYPQSTFVGSSNALAVGPSGTVVAAGFGQYLARSSGAAFQGVLSPSPTAAWWNGAAAAAGGRFWVAGDHGALGRSLDDGVTWADVSPALREDLYAVSFFDAQTGVAVGAHGMALVTHDGGDTWVSRPTGLDGMLADVLAVDAHTAIAVGEGGLVATLTF